MTLDNAIRQAIADAVEAEGQPATLSEKLVSWFTEVASGNESIDNKEDVWRRIEILFNAVEVPEAQED